MKTPNPLRHTTDWPHLIVIVEFGLYLSVSTGQSKCDGTLAETRFRLSAKRTSPLKSAWASVQSTTGNILVELSHVVTT